MEKSKEKIMEKLRSIKGEIISRDLLYNLERVNPGDFILTFRRSGGGIVCKKKNVLSIKRLDDIFGFYFVNNNIIVKRHKTIREILKNLGLISDEALIEHTFKTDTYLIRADHKIGDKRFSDLSSEEVGAMLSSAVFLIKQQMQAHIRAALIKKDLNLNNAEYIITCGIAEVLPKDDSLVPLELRFPRWNWVLWQRMAKADSCKAAVMAEMKGRLYSAFSKKEFDSIVESIVFLNNKTRHEFPDIMEKTSHGWILKEDAAIKMKSYCEDSKIIINFQSIEYFEKLKILEEIITYPKTAVQTLSNYYRTKDLADQLDNKINELKQIEEISDAEITKLDLLLKRSALCLDIDSKNNEFNSDIKFFSDSRDLKIGKYHLLYIDIKNAGVKTRLAHEKLLLEYHNKGKTMASFISITLNAYTEFIRMVSEVQETIKRICEKYLKGYQPIYLAYGDEVFVLLEDHKMIGRVFDEIKSNTKTEVRMVTTYFNIDDKIRELGTGRQVIEAFDAIRFGNKISKHYERDNEKFSRIVLIDPDFTHKTLESMSELDPDWENI